MGRTYLPRGQDKWGIVHIDSRAKHSYIWPVCGTPYLDIDRLTAAKPISCLECLANAVTYGYEGA